MSSYVFNDPDTMFHWIDETAKKLLSIPRDKFGKIEVNITRTDLGVNYDWLITPQDKQRWKKRFEDEEK